MISNKNVFFLGSLSGLVAGLAWGLIIFTGFAQLFKVIILIIGVVTYFYLQNYTMKGVGVPNSKEMYSSKFWSLTSQRFQKFSIFFSGALAPYFIALASYIVFSSIK
ncbi:hypothetical protein [Cellvibrio zantedeschiae]|uniref:hypothetical protein n=1 Tax=Cellvibrio zantedeschiae TaxID=1237077 RepID=UPI001676F2EE|nr:hypothetical protein [Cellvibrio zantedeschiae]